MMKNKIVVMLLIALFLVVAPANADDGAQKKKQNPTRSESTEKKCFLSWLLKDFKITKAGATLSVTKKKADYFNLYHLGNDIVLEDESIFLESGDKKSLVYTRTILETLDTPERHSFFDIYYGKSAYEEDDGDEILKDLMLKFPKPMKVLENYSQFHWKEDVKKLKLKIELNWRIYEKWYVFPVLEEEREAFLKLVPTDKFSPEIYDGFVVLRRIHSKEEAEKRKDFLLNTDGKSKGMWNIVNEYKGKRGRAKNSHIDILLPKQK